MIRHIAVRIAVPVVLFSLLAGLGLGVSIGLNAEEPSGVDDRLNYADSTFEENVEEMRAGEYEQEERGPVGEQTERWEERLEELNPLSGFNRYFEPYALEASASIVGFAFTAVLTVAEPVAFVTFQANTVLPTWAIFYPSQGLMLLLIGAMIGYELLRVRRVWGEMR